MNVSELLEAAKPTCMMCEKPIARVECRWHQDEDGSGRWVPGPFFKICPDGHMELVEALDG